MKQMSMSFDIQTAKPTSVLLKGKQKEIPRSIENEKGKN